jgi:DNA topoisomerase-1
MFDASPVTGQPVKVLEGRFGTYVTDGTTNATLPKGTSVNELTFDEALGLLAERAARGPVERPRRGARRSGASGGKKSAKSTKPAAPPNEKPDKAKPPKAAKRSPRKSKREA